MGKKELIKIFNNKVKGKIPDVTGINTLHDGKEGHWLEKQFGVKANNRDEADIDGFELKNETSSKISFGDWSANSYIFKNAKFETFKNKAESRNLFMKIFGHLSPNHKDKYSWSGKPIPKIQKYNDYGQILVVKSNKDIVILYSFSRDKRHNKFEIVPQELQKEDLVLAIWYGENLPSGIGGKTLKKRVEDKFNQKGWFTCKKNKTTGRYEKICFGGPISFDQWIEEVKKGVVFFDSGMYQGNQRNYSQWRAENKFWENLITDTY